MIRIATEADVPAILSIYAPYIMDTTITFEYDVPTEAEFLARFRSITRRYPWLVWEEDGQILGYAHGSAPFERAAFRWSCETSVYLRPDARGKGIGRTLCTALEKLLAAQGHRLCYAIITSDNVPSLAFHRRLGYTVTARLPGCGFKFGRWLGVIWVEKTLNFVQFPSDFPVEWYTLRQDAQKISQILSQNDPF
ncbi:MAG: N-acetyltransferase [Oscillospiraceae bacterium]|nr:N-acetyltransferase [Oscillospiraceae bacterium]